MAGALLQQHMWRFWIHDFQTYNDIDKFLAISPFRIARKLSIFISNWVSLSRDGNSTFRRGKGRDWLPLRTDWERATMSRKQHHQNWHAFEAARQRLLPYTTIAIGAPVLKTERRPFSEIQIEFPLLFCRTLLSYSFAGSPSSVNGIQGPRTKNSGKIVIKVTLNLLESTTTSFRCRTANCQQRSLKTASNPKHTFNWRSMAKNFWQSELEELPEI